jgi:thioredoxin 1
MCKIKNIVKRLLRLGRVVWLRWKLRSFWGSRLICENGFFAFVLDDEKIEKFLLFMKNIMADLLHINGEAEFKAEVMDFDGVVLVDCYADRCGPCRMLGPVMEELSDDNADKTVKIVKIDVDNPANGPIAQQFQVSSIPAVFVIKNGEVKENVI